MSNKKRKKIFILKAQLTSAIFLLIVALISGFFIFGPKLTEVARALNPSYHRSSGGQLDSGVWNNVVDDALDKNGDTMAGPLTLPTDPTANMQAATKQYVDNTAMSFSGVEDETGTPMRMVCGSRPLTFTNTEQHVYKLGAVDALHITFNDLDTGLSSPHPFYFINLTGLGNMYKTTGGNTSYLPNPNGFQMYLKYIDADKSPPNSITPAEVVGWGWVVNWCAVGY